MQSLSIIANDKIIDQVFELSKHENISASNPVTIGREKTSLNAPILPEHAEELLKAVSLIFGTLSSVVGFLAKLRSLIGEGQSIQVKDAKTGKKLIDVKRDTTIDEIQTTVDKMNK